MSTDNFEIIKMALLQEGVESLSNGEVNRQLLSAWDKLSSGYSGVLRAAGVNRAVVAGAGAIPVVAGASLIRRDKHYNSIAKKLRKNTDAKRMSTLLARRNNHNLWKHQKK